MRGRFTISVESGKLAEVLGVETIPAGRNWFNVARSHTALDLEWLRSTGGK